jgi:outer membrane scaffolding protein for murein synthesis (MipA/OmpV family)
MAPSAFRLLHGAVLLSALTAPLPALAELSNEGLIGPAVRSRAAYDGSDSQRGELVPLARYFGRPLFLRSTQGVFEGGARWELAPGLNFELRHLGSDARRSPLVERSANHYLAIGVAYKF